MWVLISVHCPHTWQYVHVLVTPSKAQNTRPSPSSLLISSASKEDFDIDVPSGDNSEKEDNLPVQSAGHMPNTTSPKIKINNPPSIFSKGPEEMKKTEYEFFFTLKSKDMAARRECLHCM
jgi:hypothetical protein